MGLTRTDGGIHVSAVAAAKACSLLLFVKEDKNGKEARFREVRNIPFPEEGKTGHVWSMTLNGAFDDLYYAFEADGKRFSDPYGRSFAGRERWGRLSHAKRLLLSPVAEPEFDWQGDRPLHIPYEDCIVYRAHVRGLTSMRLLGQNTGEPSGEWWTRFLTSKSWESLLWSFCRRWNFRKS